MTTGNRISTLSKVLLLLAAIFLATNIFLPIWKIDLFAPQYPEGLKLQLYASGLGGDVEIINGLNHYIGMQTLHSENFVEFTVLPYIISFFVLLFTVVALIGRKKPVYYLFGLFVAFAILAMADFYRWNYNYGHNLDPNAAIKVPGQAYQPPILGYKQLLNFGAYSVPDTGGLLFIGAGVLLLFIVMMETGLLSKIFRKKEKAVGLLMLIFFLSACEPPGPRPVSINKDECAYCKMTVTDVRFAAQAITEKGRHYIFDDIVCLRDFKKENKDMAFHNLYVANYTEPSEFVDVDNAYLVHSESLRSPMAGNIAVFAERDSSVAYKERWSGAFVEWTNLLR